MMFKPTKPSPKHKVLPTRLWQWGLLGAVLIILGLVWFLLGDYRYHYRTLYYPIQKAHEHQYFAAEQYLQEHDDDKRFFGVVNGSNRHDLEFFVWSLEQDDPTQKLIIVDSLNAGDHEVADALIRWVMQGGHLMTYRQHKVHTPKDFDDEHQGYFAKENPILTQLGIYYGASPDGGERNASLPYFDCNAPLKIEGKIVVVGTGCGYFGIDSQRAIRKNLNYQLYDYQAFDASLTLADLERLFGYADKETVSFWQFLQDYPLYSTPNGALLDGRLGKGRLTILSDKYVFASPVLPSKQDDQTQTKPKYAQSLQQKIVDYQDERVYLDGLAAYDNAYLFDYLTKDTKGMVDVFVGLDVNFFALLRTHFALGLFAVVMMLAAVLLAMPRQFGRYEQLLDDSEYNYLRYFEQVSGHLWRADHMVRLVADNRHQLLGRISAILNLAGLDKDEVCRLIAKELNVSDDVVYQALYGTWQTEQEFLQVSQHFAYLVRQYW